MGCSSGGFVRALCRTGTGDALATPYRWLRIFPRRIQTWREVNELRDRELMIAGRWLADASAGRGRQRGPAQQVETR